MMLDRRPRRGEAAPGGTMGRSSSGIAASVAARDRESASPAASSPKPAVFAMWLCAAPRGSSGMAVALRSVSAATPEGRRGPARP